MLFSPRFVFTTSFRSSTFFFPMFFLSSEKGKGTKLTRRSSFNRKCGVHVDVPSRSPYASSRSSTFFIVLLLLRIPLSYTCTQQNNKTQFFSIYSRFVFFSQSTYNADVWQSPLVDFARKKTNVGFNESQTRSFMSMHMYVCVDEFIYRDKSK